MSRNHVLLARRRARSRRRHHKVPLTQWVYNRRGTHGGRWYRATNRVWSQVVMPLANSNATGWWDE